MARISYAPFGRGSTLTKSIVQSLYDSIKTLCNTTKLSDDNFAVDAGVPESFFNMYIQPLQGHRHTDGTLGIGVIGPVPLNLHKDSRRVQWVETQCPGILLVAGITPGLVVTDVTDVSFSSTAITPSKSFPSGTVPMVFLTPVCLVPSAGTSSDDLHITSVTSSGFTVGNSGLYEYAAAYFALGMVPYTSLL